MFVNHFVVSIKFCFGIRSCRFVRFLPRYLTDVVRGIIQLKIHFQLLLLIRNKRNICILIKNQGANHFTNQGSQVYIHTSVNDSFVLPFRTLYLQLFSFLQWLRPRGIKQKQLESIFLIFKGNVFNISLITSC